MARHSRRMSVCRISKIRTTTRLVEPRRPSPAIYLVGSVTTNQVLSYWTMLSRSSQCAQQALLLRTTRGCQNHRRLNLIDPSRSLTTTGWHRRTLEWFICWPSFPPVFRHMLTGRPSSSIVMRAGGVRDQSVVQQPPTPKADSAGHCAR